ncbi:MAG: AI-2E family transporter [Acidimicrobiales bacterium]|nr:AI-2E family transporter [Acidimicrobiales bacterium]
MFERITSAGRVAWGLLGLAAALAVLFWIGWQFRVVIPPLVLAGAIVFILNPVVSFLARRGLPRAAGTGLSYLGFASILVLTGFLVAPLVQRQADDLADEWPEIRDDLIAWLDDISEQSKDGGWFIEIPNWDELRDQLGGTDSDEVAAFDEAIVDAENALNENGDAQVAQRLGDTTSVVRSDLGEEQGLAERLNTVREVGTRIFEVGLIFVLAPIIAFYLLVDLPHIGAIVRKLIPERAEPQVLHVGHRLNNTIGGFFRGQLAVALIVGAMVSLGLGILGLPFWLIVGMIAGVFNLIPLIGPWVGAVPGIVIALTTRDFGTAIWVAVIMTVAQQIDNHFISPLVMQRTTSLHPAVVMMALLAGGSLGGFFGLLLAVPVTASLKVIIGHLWAVYVLEQPVEEVLAAENGVPPPDDGGSADALEDDVDDVDGVAGHDDADRAAPAQTATDESTEEPATVDK